MPSPEEQLEECRKHKVVAFWLDEGDLLVKGGEDEGRGDDESPFAAIATPEIAEKLTEAGYESLQDVVAASVKDLTELNGVGEATAEKLIAAATEALAQ